MYFFPIISKIQTLYIIHRQNNNINATSNFYHTQTFKVINELKTPTPKP
jgi:hypothetical protein